MNRRRDTGIDGATTIDRQFDTDNVDPNVEVVSVIAELEGVPAEELPPLYDCIDHILEHLFESPPSEGADVEMSFTYYDYRITVEQNGAARFERLT